MRPSQPLLAGLCAAALAFAGAASAQDHHRSSSYRSDHAPCFFINQWQGWSAPSDDVILLHVEGRGIYRVGLSTPTPMLKAPGVHLISRFEGTDTVCDPLDLDLEVSDAGGMRLPVIADSLTLLTPEEAAAVPPKYRP
ncbi:MAG: DUF6491 family protein [Caulobacteraceae bacterium]